MQPDVWGKILSAMYLVCYEMWHAGRSWRKIRCTMPSSSPSLVKCQRWCRNCEGLLSSKVFLWKSCNSFFCWETEFITIIRILPLICSLVLNRQSKIHYSQSNLNFLFYGDTCDIIVIIERNGHNHLSSNLWRGCLHFTKWHTLEKGMNPAILPPVIGK